MTILHNLLSREQGMASIMVGLSMAALMGVCALAVDVGRIYVKRGALQTAADAGALAGANSFLAEGSDIEKLRAIITNYAERNLTAADIPNDSVTPTDIVFLRNGVPDEENPDQVEVTVTLSEAQGNPFPLYFGKAIGIPFTTIQVVSRAGLVGICSSKCVKPFVVPTKFTWNDSAAPATKYFENGTLDVDSLQEFDSVEALGYTQDDVGTQIIIKPGDPSLTIAPGQYNLVDLPPINKGNPTTGAAMVKENIEGCTGSNSEYAVEPGDELLIEPGNSAGPVKAGANTLIGLDPYAQWDTSTNSIEGSSFSDPLDSPRVVIMTFYDPRYPPTGGRNTITVYELGAFFIEDVDSGGNVTARFINTVAVDPEPGGSEDCLLRISRLMLDSSRQ
ncbi:pilus assembly protein TadG-related protein [uncultured Pseudodesulfovibrio sp.]|uniref:pilus assembly protein TadG-related protein n=1 Tax=uncultured Pseudodesulfovibrio sp. TaxID=2035858 RepID=UPI0029C6C487|nr:pilus assembly protein TadG-related protein [uncultured Pseudodesulfovibrio sp.]